MNNGEYSIKLDLYKLILERHVKNESMMTKLPLIVNLANAKAVTRIKKI